MNHFKVGQKVKVNEHNDNENYDSFRNKVLIIESVSKNREDHPGYDESMKGEYLYDLRELKTNKEVCCSLYDYELQKA